MCGTCVQVGHTRLFTPLMTARNGVRFRNVVFTINNPSEDENGYVKPTWCPEKMSYLGFALEKGESGTVHWQGNEMWVKII